MNERIRELYLYAFPPSLNDSTTVQMGAEKFAQLIVEECAQRAEAYAYMSANFTALAEELRRMVDVK